MVGKLKAMLALLLALTMLGHAALAEETPEATQAPAEAAEPAEEAAAEAEETEEAAADEAAEAPADEAFGSVTITVTAVGDCTFSGEAGSKANKHFAQCVLDNGYDYFFQNVRGLFEADDLTIVNLEGPLTTAAKPKKHGYTFRADPECVGILTGSSVELCNLANNHSLDFGPAGLKDTAQVLADNGIGYCGFSEVWNATIKGVRVTALGFTKWDNTPEEVYQAVSEARANCELLIVNMHWGWERHYQQCEAQVDMGHLAVDAGADLVIGTHPHVYQGIEKYKGRYIVYSLGNFCFAGNADPKDKRCLIFQQAFNFNPGMGIVQANFMDAGINIIPATISSVPDTNDFRPTVMPAKEGAALLKDVAGHSAHLSLTDTLWMKGSYLEENGLIKKDAE